MLWKQCKPNLKGQKEMVGGTKRRSAAATTSSSPLPPPPSAAKKRKPQPTPFTSEELMPLLRLLASAISGPLRFLSSADHLLLPSQSLSLDSSIESAAFSLSGLLTLLPPDSFPLDPPPPHSPWFSRFVAAFPADDRRWVESFRMSKLSFDGLLQSLSHSLQSDPSAAAAVPPDVKLGAALFRLAHAAPYRAVAWRFGLPSPDAACRAFYEVCKAITDRLVSLFELSSDLRRVVRGFEQLSLPNCCGVLGFARFAVEGPSRGGSVIAQGLVDSEGRFLDVSVGWHGSMLPAQIITRTKLYKAQALVLGLGSPMELNGGSVPQYLLGGSCCPLLPRLLTPFRGVDSSLNSSKAASFNNVHARGMELVYRSFGKLRARWQLLQTSWKKECADALPYVIVASCLLHNFLVKCGEPMDDEIETSMGELDFPDFEGKGDEDGERIREMLASHLSLVSSE
ncbi:protein ANTAGONIST OF LIKE HETEROCHROMATIN PROTEIN 1 isoform X2 [Musa acuminata AAA Group]|uniref:protein ANTAGONIST OF LIKE HETEROCHROMATIN PROTEIN 1 isoform X2 n=1 Tax=Musa acuminata AAA Group TaxID=214697 RepID=UPI0031D17680